jgi:bla regulator protein blaR1
MLCILYLIAMGFLFGAAGLLVERSLPARAARRWVWCAVIPLSLVVPGYYRWHHTVSVGETGGPAGIIPSVDLWARVESWNGALNQLWHLASWSLIVWGVIGVARVSWIVWQSRRHRGTPGTPVVVDGVTVLVTGSVGPATVGVLRSRVLVPRWVLALPAEQRRYVIRHEDEHRRAHDARLLFVASLALILVPWNLALWWQLRRLHLAIEMDCDARVVSALGDASAYGEMLLEIAQSAGRGPRLQPALLGGMGSLERRLTALLAPVPLRRAQKLLVPAAAIALVLLALSMPHPIVEHAAMAPAAHAAHTTATGARR